MAQLLEEMKATVAPDVTTYATIISCCAATGGATDTAMAMVAEMQVCTQGVGPQCFAN